MKYKILLSINVILLLSCVVLLVQNNNEKLRQARLQAAIRLIAQFNFEVIDSWDSYLQKLETYSHNNSILLESFYLIECKKIMPAHTQRIINKSKTENETTNAQNIE